MHINYEAMLTDYNKNLETNLRGFAGGPPPFETWTPYDGDDEKSIGDLLDYAKADGHEVVIVNFKDKDYSYHSNRAVQAELYLNKISENLGFGVLIKVAGLKRNVLTIDYDSSHDRFHAELIKIERELNTRLGDKFDIQTLNVDDKNKRKCAK